MLCPTAQELLSTGQVGPFGTFALKFYDDGLAGQSDRANSLPLYRPGVVVKLIQNDRVHMRAMIRRAQEYQLYHELVEVSHLLDQKPFDEALMKEFLTALASILLCSRRRDPSERLMDSFDTRASLSAAMESTGLEPAKVEHFMEVLTSDNIIGGIAKKTSSLLMKARL